MSRRRRNTALNDPSGLSQHGGDVGIRDAHETALVESAASGDRDAIEALWAIAEPVVELAVQKHLNGCQNDGAEDDARAACKVEFMRSIKKFDTSRGTSIRTLWFLGFRRAVVGYVRHTARYTRTVCTSGGTELGGGGPVGTSQAVFRGSLDSEETSKNAGRMADVAEALRVHFTAREAALLRRWMACGANTNATARETGVSPRRITALVKALRAALQ